MSERESISKVMQDALDEATDSWGVKVTEKTSPNILNLFLFTGRESGDVSKYLFYKNINSYLRIYLQRHYTFDLQTICFKIIIFFKKKSKISQYF